ncbi:MAG TPA: hypothetical protein VK003_00210 [Oceanobacillus sp.]|nr:hypothetical protein [Oceanobacillus sp.]
MPFTFSWYAVGEALQLDLSGNISPDEMQVINQHVADLLAESKRKIVLLIDASALVAGYSTADQLRATQRYVDHPKLDALLVVATSKLNRLITLLAFNLVRPTFIQFSNRESAYAYLIRRGFSEAPVVIGGQ